MSIPPHREPFLLNKFLDAETAPAFELRRPCLGSINFCDYSFFQRLDPQNPFLDARFPRFKHSDFLYKLPREAVTKKDVDRAKDLSPRHHERGKWGLTICNRHSPWRTSFPDRFPRLEGNDSLKVTGPPVYRTGLESIPHGRVDLSHRRLRWIENTRGGKVFETRARDEKWDRYREGAGPITRMNYKDEQSKFGTFKKAVMKPPSMKGFYSDSERTPSYQRSAAGSTSTPADDQISVRSVKSVR